VQATVINVPLDQPTIQNGIDAAVHGDTVLVDIGTYVENIDFLGKNIVVGSNFLVTSDTAYIFQTIIDGNQNAIVVTLDNGVDSTCYLCGFTIKNGHRGIDCSGLSSPVISHCLITENVALSHFDVGVGITITDASPIIKNCVIFNNSERAGILGRGWGIQSDGYNYNVPKIINTSIVWNPDLSGGGFASYSQSFPVLINCIIWNNNTVSINSAGDLPVVVFSDIEGGWQGQGNIDFDPKFVDPENGNFNLSPDSPCIDTGTPFYVHEGDTVLNLPSSAYYGSAPDMGVFESPYTLVNDNESTVPNQFSLFQNYPNPFNSSTTFTFNLPYASLVNLSVYNSLGQLVKTLVNEQLPYGQHKLAWDAGEISSGVYIYRIKTETYSATRKCLLLK
jgi:hypothetical protein